MGVVDDDVLGGEESGLWVEEDKGESFGLGGLPVGDGSIAEKHIGKPIS